MAERVCPWWFGWVLASPIRRLFQDPDKLLAPLIKDGMRVLEPGPGMGFFTLPAARLAGPRGKVICVDLQEKMIAGLKKRAARAGLLDRIETRVASAGSLGIDDLKKSMDVVLAIAMVHEVPDPVGFFAQTAGALKPKGKFVLAEPKNHVTSENFQRSLDQAQNCGLKVLERGIAHGARTAILEKAG